ncbi:hypothetical protein [Amorphus sp. 3PC139-8]|uniref:hypothetical protein n=1 Tax=Amorphus sp. 3PC139-8 TaxID=2735676 RepID=UPI00345DB939
MTKAAIDPSISLARAAIQEAEKRGFSIDADTFRVWFAYVTQEDPLVTGYIDRLDSRGDTVTRDDIDRLLHLLPQEPPRAMFMNAAPPPVQEAPQRPSHPRPEPAPAAAAQPRRVAMRSAEPAQPARRTQHASSTPAPEPRARAAEPTAVPLRAQRPQPVHKPAPEHVERVARPNFEQAPKTAPFEKLAELPNRHAFAKDVRRRWLHPDAKKGPQTIFLSSCRRVDDGAQANKAANDFVSPMQAVMLVALTRVFEKLGPVYRYDPQTIGLILSGVNLRQTVSIAEAVRRSMEAKRALAESHGNGQIVFSSAAVSLMADEDPAKALSLADRCLTAASKFDVSRVICETDPEMQPVPAATKAERPIADQYARIRHLLQTK